MRKLLKNQIILFLLALVPIFSWGGPPLPDDEVQEILKFSDSKTGKGNLLTPPRGSIAPQILTARNYVRDIVEELVGPEIRSKGYHYVVNIYGNNSLNAWVQQYNPVSGKSESANTSTSEGWPFGKPSDSQEGLWIKAHPGQIWPLRKAWGFPDDGKPIFEIGVTTDLLRSLTYKDELAFILGHEATHLLEGHTDHAEGEKEVFKKWWSKQPHEVVADKLGVDKILGKYELDAALTVMEKLHPKRDDVMSVNEALSAAIGTHHAEGVRITALQFYIEYLRRFNPKATPRAWTEIPQSVKVDVYGRPAPAADPTGSPEARRAYFKWIEALLRGEVNTVDIY